MPPPVALHAGECAAVTWPESACRHVRHAEASIGLLQLTRLGKLLCCCPAELLVAGPQTLLFVSRLGPGLEAVPQTAPSAAVGLALEAAVAAALMAAVQVAPNSVEPANPPARLDRRSQNETRSCRVPRL